MSGPMSRSLSGDEELGRVPPHNLEAEASFLGSAVLDQEILGDSAQILSPDDFYSTRHQILYETLLDLYDRGQAVDLVILKDVLSAAGKLEKAGGVEGLVSITESVPSAANGMHYAEIVRQKAIVRRLIQSATKIIQEAQGGSGFAVDELLDRAEQAIFEIASNRDSTSAVEISEILKETFDKIDRMSEAGGGLEGLGTGFYDLDNMTAGLQPSQLVVVAGRPSMGKTSFALAVAANAALREEKTIVIFSLETSRQQITENILCMRSRVDAHRLRKGEITEEEWPRLTDAADRLSASRIIIDDSPGLTPLALKAKARRIKAKHGLGLIVVDYLQLMDAPQAESRQQEISVISRSLKAVGRELEVPVIALSQLNRSVDAREDHRPRLSDLRESGAIEQDADIILFLFREEYYEPTEENRGMAEVIVAKQRNGPTGKVDLRFRGSCLRFENPALPGHDDGFVE